MAPNVRPSVWLISPQSAAPRVISMALMRTRTLLCCVLGGLTVATLHAQSQKPPQILIESLAGRDSYQLYCSPCHGRTGQGDGPVAPALKTRPTDLSRLTERSGRYPAERVRTTVAGTGTALPAHGSSDMPVWGQIFGAFESDVRVRERIANLVTYIETLQQPSSGQADPGAQLFRTYCASCHGTRGRGDGPAAGQMRKLPPDLTTFTKRNGGVFPDERVRQILDGRGVGAHGDRDMPVWGDAFQVRDGLTAEAVQARIAAITRYLQRLQGRDVH